MRTLFLFVGFWLYQLFILPWLVAFTLLDRIGKRKTALKYAQKTAHRWASHLLLMSGVTVRVHGEVKLPEDQAALFIGNHQGAFDIPLWGVYAGRPVAFLAKKELQKIPLIGKWMTLTRCVFIVREDRRQSLAAIREAIASLQEGLNLVVFPEGTRSGSMEMAPFKKGSLSIAQKAGVPIIPITVKGSFKAKPEDQKKIVPVEIDLFIDDPIDPTQLSPEEQENIHERVQAVIQANLDRP